jgi:hypothetical protein
MLTDPLQRKLMTIPHMYLWSRRGGRGQDRMVVQLSMQSVPITTNVVSSNPAQARYT